MHASQTCKSRNSMSPVAVAVLAALATAGPARAQQAPRRGVGLEEIIVTAQKREQNLQEVPIAVSVVTGSLLDAVGGVQRRGAAAARAVLNIRKTNTRSTRRCSCAASARSTSRSRPSRASLSCSTGW